VGCGDSSGLPPRYRISGTVTYNGKNLEHGNINFVPDGPAGRPAGGTIVDGAYSLTTQDKDDGAVPGKYKISVIAKSSDASKVQLKIKKRGEGPETAADQKAYAAVFPQKVAAKAAAMAKNLIPAKYSSPETSGLGFEVKEQSNSSVNFDLKD
jgi:hypothetical protein